jgi:hypothetical protein
MNSDDDTRFGDANEQDNLDLTRDDTTGMTDDQEMDDIK